MSGTGILARRLLEARRSNTYAEWRDVVPPSVAAAYDVQWETLAQLGPVGGWKIGAANPDVVPIFAPLPAAVILASGSELTGPDWRLRGVELELALRLGRDLSSKDAQASDADLLAAIDSFIPAIEVVETRLAEWGQAPATVKQADLQTNGALILGAPVRAAALPDLASLHTRLEFDGRPVADNTGGNRAGSIARLLRSLALQTQAMPARPKAGDVVTTGSCTGMLFASAGCVVDGDVSGIGRVSLRF